MSFDINYFADNIVQNSNGVKNLITFFSFIDDYPKNWRDLDKSDLTLFGDTIQRHLVPGITTGVILNSRSIRL